MPPLLVIALVLVAIGVAVSASVVRPQLARWPVDNAHVTSEYRSEHRPNHMGMDLRALTPVDVFACLDGMVIRADVVDDSSAGCNVAVAGNGAFAGVIVKFFHLSQVNVVVGNTVGPNTVIGKSGRTNGTALGGEPHLHFECLTLVGNHYNPRESLPPLPPETNA